MIYKNNEDGHLVLVYTPEELEALIVKRAVRITEECKESEQWKALLLAENFYANEIATGNIEVSE